MKSFSQFITEARETKASQEAKRLGLVGNGHGDWYDKKGNLKAKTIDELKDHLKLLRKEQFNLRFQVSNGQNENPARFGLIRKEIACIKTILNNVASTKSLGN